VEAGNEIASKCYSLTSQLLLLRFMHDICVGVWGEGRLKWAHRHVGRVGHMVCHGKVDPCMYACQPALLLLISQHLAAV
jgi:hypothetical protein